MPAKAVRRKIKRGPQQLLDKMFVQLQAQLDEFERRAPDGANLEKETKLLCALAATLERLSHLRCDMKQKSGKQNAAKAVERQTVIRALCDRLEKLAQADGPEGKNSGARKRADKRAG